MKKILYTTAIALLLMACGSEQGQSVEDLIAPGDLEAIRAKKNDISEQQKALELDAMQLDSVIAILDNNEKFPLVTTITAQQQNFVHYRE